MDDDGRAQRWRDPAWLATARDWIEERLRDGGIGRTGEVEQTHVTAWSTVLRVPTSAGTLWFKANEPSLRHEVVVVETVAARRPDLVPPLVASDPTTGWMLMADAGEQLRHVTAAERSLDRWHDVLSRYGALQLDLADQVPTLLRAGVPDRRLAGLAHAYGLLLDRLEERHGTAEVRRFRTAAHTVDELGAELAAFGLPELLQHDDLHDGQVYRRGAGHVILDWGDACVSHPFFTLSVTLEGVLAWGLDDVANSVDTTPLRDSYLAPFAERLGRDIAELARAVGPALRLGWVCRAVNGHVPGDDEQTFTRLRMFLDGRP